MIEEHLRALERHPMLKDAHKHIVIEANMSYISADEIAAICHRREFTNIIIESKDPKSLGRVGIWTGPYEKESYAYNLREKIKNLNICFSTHMMGTPEHIATEKKELVTELRNFRMDRLEPKDVAFGKYKYTFSGKTRGGAKDDRVLCVMMMVHWGEMKRDNDTFKLLASHKGLLLD